MIQSLSLDLSEEVQIDLQMLLSWNSLRIPKEVTLVHHC